MKTMVREDLKRAVTSLDREHRLVLLLSYADELTIEEIARVMRIGPDRAQSLLLEAVETLGVHLDPAAAA
jgi:DNA-directed RNA polymerase specialized sigma24 family protein